MQHPRRLFSPASGMLAILFLLGAGAHAQTPEQELFLTQTPTGPGVTGAANEYYIAGQTVRFRIDIDAIDPTAFPAPTVIFFDTEVPPGWTFTGVLGTGSPGVIPLSQTGPLSFGWLGAPALPVTFFIEMQVPAEETAVRTIVSRVRYLSGARVATISEPAISVMRKDIFAPQISLIGGGVTLNCQQPFVDPGVIATDNADGDLSGQVTRGGDIVNSNVPNRYTITYDVTDRSGNVARTVTRFVAVLNNCPSTTPGACDNNCADDDGTDTDGDGLTDCEEECIYGTRPDAPDTDNDGMSDAFEAQYLPALDPLDPTDREEDPDGDTFTNIQEFLRNSNPLDPASPALAFFVSPAGLNNFLLGSRDQPFRTIRYAMNFAAAVASPQRRATVVLLDGVYTEDVQMRGFVTLTGEGGAVVRGRITGAPDGRLERLTLESAGSDGLLLDLTGGGDGVANFIRGVTFRNAAVGVRTDGPLSANTIIESSVFEDLEIGLEIRGAVPKLRRNVFRDIAARPGGGAPAAIVLRPLPGKQAAVNDEGNLGDITDPGAGWNTFRIDTFEQAAVINQRPEVIKMEENDWNSDDEDEIATVIEGPADFVPFLGAGQAVFASTLLCTVYRADTQERILNATVRLSPGTYAAVTENDTGVYPFAAVPEGSYTVTVQAPGFDDATATATVGAGQIASVLVALGETPPEGCNGGNNDKSIASMVRQPGDLLLTGIVFVVLAAASRRFRRAA